MKSIFGNKSDRDLKKLMPIVNSIKAVYPEIEKLSNDELRAKTASIRASLAESVEPQRKEIAEIKAKIETLDYNDREPYWDKVDKLEKEILDKLASSAMV